MNKKTKCIDCKYWNTIVGCILVSQKNKEKMNLKDTAYGINREVKMPPKVPEELLFKEKSLFFRKGDFCEWHKFSVESFIMNRLDYFINR